jgi:hypothetical protein
MAAIDIVKGGVGLGACSDGRQRATSEGPFGVVVWGLAPYASYAYPAGGSAAVINDVDPVPQ